MTSPIIMGLIQVEVKVSLLIGKAKGLHNLNIDRDILAMNLIPLKHHTKRSTAPAYPSVSRKPMEDLGQ